MTNEPRRKVAVACASGSFKGAFVHGVLSAFEAAGLPVAAYGAASSTVLPAGYAAVGQARAAGVDYWLAGSRARQTVGGGMSALVQGSIRYAQPALVPALFAPGRPRLLVATSAVITAEGAAATQGPGARRLGQRLLVAAGRGDAGWATAHLAPYLFDTGTSDPAHRLTAANFPAVVYASTRMLHAWEAPAWVEGAPYIDASYTCACPAIELAEAGYGPVIAIATEPGPLYRDLFRRSVIPATWAGTPIYPIAPARDPRELGVDFTSATEDGLRALYAEGEAAGQAFLAAEEWAAGFTQPH